MSVLKMINKLRRGSRGLEDLYEYITAPSKTDSGRLTGTKDILTHMPLTEMVTVKKLFFKTGGRQQIHLVVSLTPDDQNRSDNVYMELAPKIAGIFEGFQSYFAVHKDTEIRHLHIVLNSVSYVDGRKFTQSKTDLHRLKQKCNDLLENYGFDPIRVKPEELLDSTDYSERNDFEFLEISEPVTNRNEISLSPEIEPYYGQLSLPSEPYFERQNPNTITGGFFMSTFNTPQEPVQPETPSYPTEVLLGQGTLLSNQPTAPTISLNTGTRYVVHLNESAPASDICRGRRTLRKGQRGGCADGCKHRVGDPPESAG